MSASIRRPSKAFLEQLVDTFNKLYPVGTSVMLRKDSGPVETVVVAPAHMLGGHSPVAWFEGVSGAYSIEHDRVSPRQ